MTTGSRARWSGPSLRRRPYRVSLQRALKFLEVAAYTGLVYHCLFPNFEADSLGFELTAGRRLVINPPFLLVRTTIRHDFSLNGPTMHPTEKTRDRSRWPTYRR